MKYQGLGLAISAAALAFSAPVAAQTVAYQSVADFGSSHEVAVYCSECTFLHSQVSDQFTLDQTIDITGVNLWLYTGADGGQFDHVDSVGYTFSVWDSTKTSLLFSQHIYPLTTLSSGNGLFGAEKFVGGAVTGLNLEAGTYWAGFELDSDDVSMTLLGFNGGNGSYTGTSVTNGDQVTANAGYQLLTSGQAATLPTPEPASWAMMLGGFGMIGGMLRSRRKSVTFA